MLCYIYEFKHVHCLMKCGFYKGLRVVVKRSACAAGNFQKTLVKSTVSKLQKWDAPKNKSQLTSRGGLQPPSPPLRYAPAWADKNLEEGNITKSMHTFVTNNEDSHPANPKPLYKTHKKDDNAMGK